MQRYLIWVTAFAAILSVVLWEVGAIGHFFHYYGNLPTLVASGIPMAIFLYAYIDSWRMASALRREGGSLSRLCQIGHCSNDGDVLRTEVQKLLRSLTGTRPVAIDTRSLMYGVMASVQRALRTTTMMGSPEHLAAADYTDRYRGTLDSLLEEIGRKRSLLFQTGLLFTLAGVMYAMAVPEIPNGADEARKFSFMMLHGLGVSYASSFFGIGGSVILYLIEGAAKREAEGYENQFESVAHEVLFPVINSSSYREKTHATT